MDVTYFGDCSRQKYYRQTSSRNLNATMYSTNVFSSLLSQRFFTEKNIFISDERQGFSIKMGSFDFRFLIDKMLGWNTLSVPYTHSEISEHSKILN